MENSKIEWTDHTMNPVVGCEKVSEACKHCYAESWAKRTGNATLWRGDRRRTSKANWRKPLKWDREAAEEGVRRRVFCASLADVFEDHPAWIEPRHDLGRLIQETPNLDWLLLTKRPENLRRMIWWGDGEPWSNVWLGTTVENQVRADERIPHLLDVQAAVHFLSCEPLLGPINLRQAAHGRTCSINPSGAIDWVIVGGESGPGARQMPIEWARSVRDQCVYAGISFFFKQWGEWAPSKGDVFGDLIRIGKKDAGRELDGRTWDEFPILSRVLDERKGDE